MSQRRATRSRVPRVNRRRRPISTTLNPRSHIIKEIPSAGMIRTKRAHDRLGSYRFNGIRNRRNSLRPSMLIRK